MRFIKKERGIPSELIHFNEREIDGKWHPVVSYKAGFGGTEKATLRKVLTEEQFCLCAYCQNVIYPNTNKTQIEHIVCQDDSDHYSLAYHNLLAVCSGNKGGSELHCDQFRANGNPYLLPLFYFEECKTKSWDEPNPFFTIELIPDSTFPTGKISPGQKRQSEVQKVIDSLNLNAGKLISDRQRAFSTLAKKRGGQNWQDLFNEYLNRPKTPFIEFLLLAIRAQVKP